MNERSIIERELEQVERQLRELEVGYEQYFAGVEKREPFQAREKMARRIRRLVTRRITQTQLRFRAQSLSARYNSYSGYWDRILRLIDEGRYFRQASTGTPSKPPPPTAANQVESLFRQIRDAHDSGQISGPPPDRRQVERFLEQQKERIREKYGSGDVEFRVEVAAGKAKIKVRPRGQD